VFRRPTVLAAVIFAASLIMWLGVPPAWIWLLSRLGGSIGSYALVLLGLPATLAVWAAGLGRLDRAYGRLVMPDSHPADPVPSVLSFCLTTTFVIALVVGVLFLALVGMPGTTHSLGPFPD
jgi:hypothetical protein